MSTATTTSMATHLTARVPGVIGCRPPTEAQTDDLDLRSFERPALPETHRWLRKHTSVPGAPSNCRRRVRGGRGERGASAAIIVLFTVAFLSVAGLVIDGGYALGAKREAMNDAEQAARAGADALSPSALRNGTTAVDPAAAVGAARSYLSSVGANGTVDIVGGRVTVTVTGEQDTTILNAVGVNSLPFKVTASALSIDEDTN